MTVRVNKSAFNIREKLSELERPIGVKGNELMRAETAQDARDLVSAGRKNLIINGNMMISQRGTSFTPAVEFGYTLDRWITFLSQTGSFNVAMGFWGLARFHNQSKQVRVTTPVDHFLWLQYFCGHQLAAVVRKQSDLILYLGTM